MSEPREDRKLSLIERFSVARHNTGLFPNFIVGARYTFLNPDIEPLLVAALEDVLFEQPILSAVLLNDESNDVRWGRLDKVDAKSLLRWRKEGESMPDVLSELHGVGFDCADKTVPLWFLSLVPCGNTSVYALFVCHHALCDGTGAKAFHINLHAALNEPKHHSGLSKTLLPASMDELLPCRPGLVLILRTILVELILPRWLSRSLLLHQPFFKGRPVPLVDGRFSATSVRLVGIEDLLLRQALVVARENQLTLTSFLWAALAAAICHNLTSDYDTIIKGQVAVDVRSACHPPPPAHLVSDYVAAHHLNAPPPFEVGVDARRSLPSRTELLSLARLVNGSLKAPNMRLQAAEGVGLLKFLPKTERPPNSSFRYDTGWESFFRQAGTSGQRAATFEVSNLNVFQPAKPSTRYSIEEMLFSQAVGSIACLIALSTITCDGAMQCVINWQATALKEDEVDGICTSFLAAFKALADVSLQ